jgi:hypothetical protein
MSAAALHSRAEIAKLARLLSTDPQRLSYLESIDPSVVAELRERATDRLFDAHGEALQRAVSASRLLPAALVAKIGEKAFGALLCARVAGLLEPGTAVDLARRLPPEFLADVAVELDPRRASDVIARIPVDHVVAVAGELARREEHVTMGRFVGHLDHRAIAATLEVLDDASLLRVAFVMEDKHRLDDIVALLSDQRVAGVIAAAAAQDLWPEARDLALHVAGEGRARLEQAARRAGFGDLSAN